MRVFYLVATLCLGLLAGVRSKMVLDDPTYETALELSESGRIHAAIRLIADQLAKLPSSPEQVISEVKPVEIFPTLKKIAHYSELLARLHHQADHIFEAAGWYQKACDDLSLYYGRDSPAAINCFSTLKTIGPKRIGPLQPTQDKQVEELVAAAGVQPMFWNLLEKTSLQALRDGPNGEGFQLLQRLHEGFAADPGANVDWVSRFALDAVQSAHTIGDSVLKEGIERLEQAVDSLSGVVKDRIRVKIVLLRKLLANYGRSRITLPLSSLSSASPKANPSTTPMPTVVVVDGETNRDSRKVVRATPPIARPPQTAVTIAVTPKAEADTSNATETATRNILVAVATALSIGFSGFALWWLRSSSSHPLQEPKKKRGKDPKKPKKSKRARGKSDVSVAKKNRNRARSNSNSSQQRGRADSHGSSNGPPIPEGKMSEEKKHLPKDSGIAAVSTPRSKRSTETVDRSETPRSGSKPKPPTHPTGRKGSLASAARIAASVPTDSAVPPPPPVSEIPPPPPSPPPPSPPPPPPPVTPSADEYRGSSPRPASSDGSKSQLASTAPSQPASQAPGEREQKILSKAQELTPPRPSRKGRGKQSSLANQSSTGEHRIGGSSPRSTSSLPPEHVPPIPPIVPQAPKSAPSESAMGVKAPPRANEHSPITDARTPPLVSGTIPLHDPFPSQPKGHILGYGRQGYGFYPVKELEGLDEASQEEIVITAISPDSAIPLRSSRGSSLEPATPGEEQQDPATVPLPGIPPLHPNVFGRKEHEVVQSAPPTIHPAWSMQPRTPAHSLWLNNVTMHWGPEALSLMPPHIPREGSPGCYILTPEGFVLWQYPQAPLEEEPVKPKENRRRPRASKWSDNGTTSARDAKSPASIRIPPQQEESRRRKTPRAANSPSSPALGRKTRWKPVEKGKPQGRDSRGGKEGGTRRGKRGGGHHSNSGNAGGSDQRFSTPVTPSELPRSLPGSPAHPSFAMPLHGHGPAFPMAPPPPWARPMADPPVFHHSTVDAPPQPMPGWGHHWQPRPMPPMGGVMPMPMPWVQPPTPPQPSPPPSGAGSHQSQPARHGNVHK